MKKAIPYLLTLALLLVVFPTFAGGLNTGGSSSVEILRDSPDKVRP